METGLHNLLEEHLSLFLVALFFSLVTIFVAWYRGYFKSSPIDPKSIKVEFSHVMIAFVIYFVLMMVVSFAIYLILASSSPEKKELIAAQVNAVRAWVTQATTLIVFTMLLIYTARLRAEVKHNVLGDTFLSEKPNTISNFGMGALTLVICFPLVVATSQLATMLLILIGKSSQEQLAVRFLKSALANPVAYIFTCFFVIIVIPIIEELLFRGFLQNWLVKFFGKVGAIISCSLVFAFFHFSMQQGWGNVEIIPSLFVLACFAGYIYFRQKTIVASIGLHASYNALNVLFVTLTSIRS